MSNNNNPLADRLIKIMEYFNITPLQLAKQMGDVRSEKLKNVLKGKNAMSFEALSNLKKGFPTISLNWLISGQGSMLVHHQQQQSFPIVINKNARTSHIPSVSSSAMKDYSINCEDPEYIDSLPIIDDDVYGDKIYRDFEVINNDIAPLVFPGDYLRAYYIQIDDAIKMIPKGQKFPNFVAIIVTHHHEVLFRIIEDYSDKWVKVKGLNESVNTRKIKLSDIKEFWVSGEIRVRNLRFLSM